LHLPAEPGQRNPTGREKILKRILFSLLALAALGSGLRAESLSITPLCVPLAEEEQALVNAGKVHLPLLGLLNLAGFDPTSAPSGPGGYPPAVLYILGNQISVSVLSRVSTK
jgi:hypothetical protein